MLTIWPTCSRPGCLNVPVGSRRRFTAWCSECNAKYHRDYMRMWYAKQRQVERHLASRVRGAPNE